MANSFYDPFGLRPDGARGRALVARGVGDARYAGRTWGAGSVADGVTGAGRRRRIRSRGAANPEAEAPVGLSWSHAGRSGGWLDEEAPTPSTQLPLCQPLLMRVFSG